VSTYPLSHPLEGWHAAITSGGHQVVHRVDPDTKTLHVGYAGHNIADAEERLGASGGEGSSLPVEFHKGAEKDFDSLHPEVQEKALNTIDRLARGEQHKFDHALTGKHWETGGWRSARADFLHRVTHRFEDNEGNPVSAPERAARLFIGHIGPHNYEAAQKRLSSLTAWFRTASLPQEWYHGSGAAFDRFDMSKNKTVQDDDDAKHWNSHLGAHFTSDHRVAQEFAQRQGGGHVYHARLDLQNPKHYESEHDLDREAAHWAHANGHDLGPTMSNPAYREQTEPDEWQFLIKYNDEGHPRPEAREIAHGFRKHLQAQGHDGITYGNEFEGAHNGFHAGERHLSAIAFHPDQIQITQRHGGAEDHEPRTAATRGVDNEGHPVELDDIDGWHHADGSVSHDDGTTISDHPVRVTEAEERLMQRQAAAVTYDDGIMVAFVPPPEIAAQLAQDGGQTADDLHITLAYLGHVADYTPEQLSLLPQLVSAWAMRQKPVTIRIGGVGTFNNAYKNQHVLWAHPDIPGGVQMHVSLVRELERYKFRLPSEHGWTPHMTLQYVNQHHRFMPQLPQIGWEATEVVTFIGTARHAARLGSRPSTTTTL
jgi:2'-5' RNA ligase